MSSEPTGRAKKYEPLDTRDFVDFSDFTEITTENIKEACKNHYGAPSGSCDILLEDRGPSCFSTQQIASKKVFFIRFVNPQAIKCQHNDRFRYSDKTKCNQSEPIRSLSTQLPPVPSNTIVPSFSITDLMKARKLVKLPEGQEETLMLESYIIEGKTWERMQPVKFLVEKEKFAEGGSREAFKTTCVNSNFTRNWVPKFYKQEKAEVIQETLKISVEDHTRKQVQMHAVARHLAVKFGKRLLQAGYGEKLLYNKVYYTNSSKDPNTMEEYVNGQCFIYINNIGILPFYLSNF